MEDARDSLGGSGVARTASRALQALPWADVAAGGLAFAVVVMLATNSGGYWPNASSWTGLLLAWLSLVALVVAPQVMVSHAERLFLMGVAALVGWTALAALWSDSVPRTMEEVQRVAAYLALVVACALVARASSYGSLLLGTWAAIAVTCLYALGTRLLPERLGQFDPVSGYRLSAPVGYWNGLGILAVIGIVLALGLAARRGPRTSIPAATSLLIVVPTLYFTFSRGAWLALAVGLVVAFALDPRRLQFAATTLTLSVCPALAVFVASGSDAMTTPTASLASATQEGRRLLALLVVLALVQGALPIGLRVLAQRVDVPPRVQSAALAASVALLAAPLVVGIARLGGPVEAAERAHREFLVPAPPSDLNARLFSLSSNGRADVWSVAWQSFEENRWAGSGPGTYEIAWLRERPYGLKVRDAHSLFAESLAEVGLVGTGILLLALAVPFAALLRGRTRSLVPVAGGGYAAFVAHAGVDWDWELLAIPAAALICGSAVLAATRPSALGPLRIRSTAAVAAAMLAVAVFSVTGVVGYAALDSAEEAAAAGSHERALGEARRAAAWQPWSAHAARIEANAQLALGRREAARAAFARAVGKDPLNWERWFDVAVVGSGDARTNAARRAERLNPLSPELRAARAWLGLEGTG